MVHVFFFIYSYECSSEVGRTQKHLAHDMINLCAFLMLSQFPMPIASAITRWNTPNHELLPKQIYCVLHVR